MFEVDSILSAPYWPERVRVIASEAIDENTIRVQAEGITTGRYYKRLINYEDLNLISIEEETRLKFDEDAEKFFLYIESHRIRNAFQFDPLYAVNVSQIDALPHQIDAVYYHILQNPRIRFLLADDPGAGKTIMAGLIIKELKYRGLIQRILIITPGHLKYQWLREMKDKFHEDFKLIERSIVEAAWRQNVFEEENQVITSIDFAKQEAILPYLKETTWDLIIVDEAHKMSAFQYGEKINKTARYILGETASEISNYLLFMTATPHRGDVNNFKLFLDLLEPGFFATSEMLTQSIQNKDNPLFLRRLKEDMKNFDGTPLFPKRYVNTNAFELSEGEKRLYDEVTKYVEEHFNKAIQKEKRNVAFAMMILQRRLASSVRAIRMSLERRRRKLHDLYEASENYSYGEYYTEERIEEWSEDERWKVEEELLERLTSADSKEELKIEIEVLDHLIVLSKEVEKQESEAKLTALKGVIEELRLKEKNNKLLIFTESRDTLNYLIEKIKDWGFSTTQIHGLMKMDDRIRAEQDFKNTAQICVATEAAGEGINLQFCSLMINYDIPWNPNRPEQRMGRIHRYGQRYEVYIYNLVAKDTREGKILIKLFEKLKSMSEQMGSDRVFDVIGDVVESGKNLRDLIIEAISNQRSMEAILEEFDRIPDEVSIEKVRRASMEALSTHHIDLYRILGEQRNAKENRLVPEYIEAFFKRSAKVHNIPVEERADGFYRIPSIPFDIRNRTTSFKNMFGEVNKEYTKVSFDKTQAFEHQGEFVAMGHPLLECLVESNFQQFSNQARNGAVFIDLDGKMDGLIYMLNAEIRDGNDQVAGKKLFCVYQEADGALQMLNPAIFWDLKPTPAGTKAPVIPNYNPDKVITHLIKEGLDRYKADLLARRQHDAEIKQKYGMQSLNGLIAKSEAKLAELAVKKIKGDKMAAANEEKEIRRRNDLDKKRKNLEKQIIAETHLLASDPNILGIARVIPQPTSEPDMFSSKEIELIGMQVAMDYEINQGRNPEDVSLKNLGYDIHSTNDTESEHRYIEVKARAQEGAILLTQNEWFMAQRLKDEYWLYIVSNAKTHPELFLIQNPAAKLQPAEVIETVRYVVKDWNKEATVAK